MSLAGTCTVRSDRADRCRLARADISVSGNQEQDIAVPITDSVQTILIDDEAFDNGLMANGIVDVRLRGDITTSPKAALQASGGTSPTGSPATTAVVTIAATGAIVLAALGLKRSGQKTGYDNLDDGKESILEDSHADTPPATVSGITI